MVTVSTDWSCSGCDHAAGGTTIGAASTAIVTAFIRFIHAKTEQALEALTPTKRHFAACNVASASIPSTRLSSASRSWIE